MQLLRASAHEARFAIMHNEEYLTAVDNQHASDEMTARPDDTFAKAVNGWYREGVLLLKPLKVFLRGDFKRIIMLVIVLL